MKYIPNAMKFGNQSRSRNVLQFLWNLALEQMEHAWDWWSWLKIMNSGKFGLKVEIFKIYKTHWIKTYSIYLK